MATKDNHTGLLDDNLIFNLCEAIRTGNYVKTACALNGITYPTYYRWMKMSRDPNCKPIYKQFATEIAKAEAEVECQVVKCWVDQTPTEWQASRDFLARRFPDRWANKEKREITGAGGGPLQSVNVMANMDLSKLTNEELESLEKITRKLQPSDDEPDLEGESEPIPE